MDTARLEREIEKRNQEQYNSAAAAVDDISSGANPFMQQ